MLKLLLRFNEHTNKEKKKCKSDQSKYLFYKIASLYYIYNNFILSKHKKVITKNLFV